MNRYIPAASLAKAVLICIALEIIMAMLSTVSSLLQAQLLMRVQAGAVISDIEASFNDLREMAIGVLAVLITIISGILFLRYLGRANHNARALGADDLSATPGWTMGYFFVPIVNLWKPYQIIQEIWKASDPEPGSLKLRSSSQLVGWWWAFHLLDNIANQVVFRLNLNHNNQGEPDLNLLLTMTWLDVGVQILDLILCVLAFQLIRLLQQRQLERYETIGEPNEIQCPSCGEQLGITEIVAASCPVCGARLETQPTETPAWIGPSA